MDVPITEPRDAKLDSRQVDLSSKLSEARQLELEVGGAAGIL